MSDVLAALGGSSVGSLVTAGVNQMLADSNRKKDYKVWEKMNDKTFNQSQQAQRQAAGNLVAGAVQAGINPLFALGQNYTPAASQAQGMPHTAAPQMQNPFSVQDILSAKAFDANIENVNAQTEKIKAETDNIKPDTDIKKRQAKFFKDLDESVIVAFSEKYSEEWTKFVQENFNGDNDKALEETTLGMVQGNKEFAQFERDEMKAILSKKVDTEILGEPEIIQSLSHMPKAEYDSIRQGVTESMFKIKEIQALTDQLNEQNFQLEKYGRNLKENDIKIQQRKIENLKRESARIRADTMQKLATSKYLSKQDKKIAHDVIQGYLSSGSQAVNAGANLFEMPSKALRNVVPFGFPNFK